MDNVAPRVELCVVGQSSSAIFAARDVVLPAGVEFSRTAFPTHPQGRATGATLWWYVIDSTDVTMDLWDIARAQHAAGAVVLVFVIGAAITAPPDVPLWFQLSKHEAPWARCPESIIWSSLGATSHIALDWNDLRTVTCVTGQGMVWEVTAETPDALVAVAAETLGSQSLQQVYLHFEGAALQGKTLKQIAHLFNERMIHQGSQIVTYEPGSAPEKFFLRALMR